MKKIYDVLSVSLKEISEPLRLGERIPVPLTEETMKERLDKVVRQMQDRQLDVLVIYGDLEHGSNFEYLTGFLPRFEEGILILHKNRIAYLLLGNENTKMVNYSRIPSKLIHIPFFSLPNQPMEREQAVTEYFREAGLVSGQRVGLVGWKLFTSRLLDNRKLYDLPDYLVKAVQEVVGEHSMENCCDLLIGGECGVRITNNANEIAHYEYGSALASDCVLNAMNHVKPGIKELELGEYLNAAGQHNSVVTIAATGDRFEYANFYPTAKAVQIGDKMSLTVGYKGGLSSRSGYVVETEEQLPLKVRDYVQELAGPYFAAVITWLENIRIGMDGGELYEIIKESLPKERYHWTLNPGHLIGAEEWMSSPIYPESKEILKNGMMLQIDIIPGLPGYAGTGCESGIVLANEKLRNQIYEMYPDLYDVFMERRAYMRQVLNIEVPEDVLPMNDTVAYYRPYFLNQKLAFAKKN